MRVPTFSNIPANDQGAEGFGGCGCSQYHPHPRPLHQLHGKVTGMNRMRFFHDDQDTVPGTCSAGPPRSCTRRRSRTFTPITRGRVENDINKCIFCGLCARRCPTYAIEVTKDRKEWQIDRLKCCTCNLCVEICPVKCLSMEIQYSPPIAERTAAIYKMKAMFAAGTEEGK